MSARDLWSAVVLQAANDIDTEDYASVEYGQAVSFFLAPGEWSESRQNIADCLELHPDDLIRLGRAAIAARLLRDGPEPVSSAPEHDRSRPPRCIWEQPMHQARRPVKDRDWWIQRFLAKQAA